MDCRGCIFAEVDDAGAQTGCNASRLGKYIKLDAVSYNKDDRYYELSRVCTFKRDMDWLESKCHPKYRQYNAVEIARREVEPTFGIVIYDDSLEPDGIFSTLNSIKNIDYNKNKYVIVWSLCEYTRVKREMPVIDAVKLVNDMKVGGYKMWLNLHQDLTNIETRDRECFSKVAKSSYWMKITTETETHVPVNIFKDVDASLNDKLETQVLFEDKNQTWSMVPSMVARLKYLDHKDYGLMIDDIRRNAQKENLYTEVHET